MFNLFRPDRPTKTYAEMDVINFLADHDMSADVFEAMTEHDDVDYQIMLDRVLTSDERAEFRQARSELAELLLDDDREWDPYEAAGESHFGLPGGERSL